MKRSVLVIVAVLVAIYLAAVSPVAYGMIFNAGRMVILTFAAQKTVELVGGALTGNILGWLAGVGGLLYVVGVCADWAHMPMINGRDVDFLVRSVGLSFLVLPLALANLPRRAQQALGVC